MTETLVVCFSWQDRDTPALQYLKTSAEVRLRLQAPGAQPISWGADRQAFVCAVTSLHAVLRTAAEVLADGLAHTAGIAARQLEHVEDRYFGSSLVLAEHLALAARPKEILLDPVLGRPSWPGLVENGTIPIQVGSERLAATLLLVRSGWRAESSSWPLLDPSEPVTVRRIALDPEVSSAPELGVAGEPASAAFAEDRENPPAAANAVASEHDDSEEGFDRPTLSEVPHPSVRPEPELHEPEGFEPGAPAPRVDDQPVAEPESLRAADEARGPQSSPDESANVAVAPDEPEFVSAVSVTGEDSEPLERTLEAVAITDEQLDAFVAARAERDTPTPSLDAMELRPLEPSRPETEGPTRVSQPPPKPSFAGALLRRPSTRPPPKPSKPPSLGPAATRVSQPPPKPQRLSGAPRPEAEERDPIEDEALDPEANRASDPGSELLRAREIARVVRESGAEERAQTAHDLAVALLDAGRTREALLEALQALAAAREIGDLEQERHTLRLIATLADAHGQVEVVERLRDSTPPGS